VVACSSVGGTGDEAEVQSHSAGIAASSRLSIAFVRRSSVGSTELRMTGTVERLVVDEAGDNRSEARVVYT